MRVPSLTFVLLLSLWGASAHAHGGDGLLDAPNLSQMASDGSAVGASGSPDGGGGPGTEIPDGPSGPPPLSQPTTVSNSTVRSVPDRPGEQKNPIRLDHPSILSPRSPGGMAIYERAYNADLQLVNKWLDSFK